MFLVTIFKTEKNLLTTEDGQPEVTENVQLITTEDGQPGMTETVQ